jgi:NAD(P)-dependent dehydrogenase (short-subunit alcohol dehydrogenase family)
VADWHGKVALVTGGSSGIGAACVAAFLAEGAAVVAVSRDPEKAAAAAARLGQNEKLMPFAGDVRDPAFCERAVDATVARFGKLNALVNSAGIIRRGDAFAISDADWNNTWAVNVSGTFFMCRAGIRSMRQTGGGAIVNVSSDWGLVGGRGHIAYCTSKAAVVNMTRALALDHAADGIRVNVICPGEVRTPMLASGLATRGFAGDDSFARLGATIPIGRISEPEEQARAILFLASPEASYVTGAVLSADGGSTAR